MWMFWNRAAVITSHECGVEAQADILHPLISERLNITCSPVLLHICSKACGNPASSLHHPCENYELLQPRVFVSNSLILQIIIDYRCLAKSVFEVFSFLSFYPSPSLLLQWTKVICPASPRWRASPFLNSRRSFCISNRLMSFHPVWWRGRHRKRSQAVQLGCGATCCIPPVALVIWSVWTSVCVFVCACVSVRAPPLQSLLTAKPFWEWSERREYWIRKRQGI